MFAKDFGSAGLTLEEKVNILMDERDIRACLYRYNRAVDRGDLDLVKTCFHDGALDHHAPFFDDTVENVIEFMRSPPTDHVTDPLLMTQYTTGTVNIELDGDAARVESYIWSAKKLQQRGESGHPLMRLSGIRYLDRFERRNGEWKIAERWFVPEWGFFQEVPPQTHSIGIFKIPSEQKQKPFQSERGRDDISNAAFGKPGEQA
jgi:hypothetical protein